MPFSAAFDTVDHSRLLQRRRRHLGTSGAAFQWFKAYIAYIRKCINVPDSVFHSTNDLILSDAYFLIYHNMKHSKIQSILSMECFTGPQLKYVFSLSVPYT